MAYRGGNGDVGGGSQMVKYFRSHVGNIAVSLLVIYSCALFLLEIRSRVIGNGGSRTGHTSNTHTATGKMDSRPQEGSAEPPPAASASCRRSVYNWGREDRRFAKALKDRKDFYKQVQIGGHLKDGLVKLGHPETLILYAFQPYMSCADLQRFGGVPDGGKVLCEADRLLDRDDSCLVYSFGVGYDCKFEMDLLSYFPKCEIYMFDPSVVMGKFIESHCSLPQIHFYPWGLRGDAVPDEGDAPPPQPKESSNSSAALQRTPMTRTKAGFFSLTRILEELGHTGRKIHLMKMDIEGGEFDSLLYLMAPKNKHLMFDVNLFVMELHGAPPGYQERLVSELEANDLRLYFTERNPYYPAVLVEIALLNGTALRMVDTGSATPEF